MNPELEKQLYEKHSALFKEPVPFGFMCGDGWFNLIDALCLQLSRLDKIPVPIQIKEKFGGLRFYTAENSKEAFALVDLAEILSYRVCEQCGCPGTKRSDGWIRVLCEKCHDSI